MSTKLPAALAALLFPMIALADSTNVTFCAALTNGTGWTYSTGFDYVKSQKLYGLTKGDNGRDQITTPTLDFAITSVVVHAKKASAATSRKMAIRATSGTANLSAVKLDIPAEQIEFSSEHTWPPSNRVRSFALLTTGGSGNLYLKSVVISGEPIVDAPTGLRADEVTGTRCQLSWTSPANAVSNRVDVSRVVTHATAGEVLEEYDFSGFSNPTGNPTNRTDDFIAQYPAFAGSSLIYLPTNTAGKIQISTDSQKGFLVHSGFADCSDVTLLLSLKIPNNEQGKTFGIGYESAAGVTNEVAAIPVDREFKTNLVSLAQVPADTPIIFNTQGANTKRRVVVDYLAFVRDHGPAHAETNHVKTVFASGSEKTVKGLAPNSSYVVQVTAFGAEGNMSPPSSPLAFETNNSKLPLVVKVN